MQKSTNLAENSQNAKRRAVADPAKLAKLWASWDRSNHSQFQPVFRLLICDTGSMYKCTLSDQTAGHPLLQCGGLGTVLRIEQ